MVKMENRDRDNVSRNDEPNDASDTSRDVASRRRQQGDSELDFGEKTGESETVKPNNRYSRRPETEH
jgi:hypothetical protein